MSTISPVSAELLESALHPSPMKRYVTGAKFPTKRSHARSSSGSFMEPSSPRPKRRVGGASHPCNIRSVQSPLPLRAPMNRIGSGSSASLFFEPSIPPPERPQQTEQRALLRLPQCFMRVVSPKLVMVAVAAVLEVTSRPGILSNQRQILHHRSHCRLGCLLSSRVDKLSKTKKTHSLVAPPIAPHSSLVQMREPHHHGPEYWIQKRYSINIDRVITV